MFRAPHPPPNGKSSGVHDEQESRKVAGLSTVPRSTSGMMRRVAPMTSGPIGAVNEDDFRKNFSAGVKISIFDARTLSTEMSKARECMADDKQDWSKRTNALKMFRGVYQNGGRDFEDIYLQEVLQSEEALLVSVKDLRSQVCREACVTVSYLSEELGSGIVRLAESLLPPLINLIQNSAKVMSTSGILAANFLVRNIQHPKLIPTILAGLSSKSKEIRRETQSMLGYVLDWDTKKVERSVPQIVDAIKSGLGDADPGARANARSTYTKLENAFPRSAEMLYKSLDPSKQRALSGGTQSQSSSSQSIVSERDTLAFNHRPGGFGLQKQKTFFGARSTSEIDPGAARRAGLTPRRVQPGGGLGTGIRKIPTPVGSTLSRVGLPPSGGTSRMMRSTTPSGMAGSNGPNGNGAGSASQPGSRSTCPSAHSRIPNPARGTVRGRKASNGTTSRDANPLRRNVNVRGYDLTDGPTVLPSSSSPTPSAHEDGHSLSAHPSTSSLPSGSSSGTESGESSPNTRKRRTEEKKAEMMKQSTILAIVANSDKERDARKARLAAIMNRMRRLSTPSMFSTQRRPRVVIRLHSTGHDCPYHQQPEDHAGNREDDGSSSDLRMGELPGAVPY